MADRIPYDALWPDARDALIAWLQLHRVDPKQTPVDPVIELDVATDEWRIEQYAGVAGRLRLTADRNDVQRITIRRVSRAPLPWPEVAR
ncbi:hypothetical protein ACIA8K_06945 [Catenuloplanes sp. NPDC051500]|uniref:hypothetical protein n=1 Tax=Catenuloplanes sp. NPDC051500 TaxID=3363959 RepID=UPI0037A24627